MRQWGTGLAGAWWAWLAACLALVLGTVPVVPLLPAACGVVESWRAASEWHPPVGQGFLKLLWWRLARLGVVSAVLFTWLTAAVIGLSQVAMLTS